MGEPLSDEDAEDLLNAADADGNGLLDMNEFVSVSIITSLSHII